ncbi:MAG: hypothetical protein LUE29_00330 [Lachnospiraceae bacterium]|nr:hypothetical protein [Lachnospiraceae bacterium]
MQISARILGRSYGLTAEEMNRVLVKLGFLEGIPGDYSPTEKALPYVVEKDFHMGTGGYDHYNRYWTTKTFDDSIKEVLDVPKELISEVRDELTAIRAARAAERAIAREIADAQFLAKQEAEREAIEAAEQAAKEKKALLAMWKKIGIISIVVGGTLVITYGVYKATPKVKAWWEERNQKRNVEEVENNNSQS